MNFSTFFLQEKPNLFQKLVHSAQFETFGQNRFVAILVEPKDRDGIYDGIPIVRTTTIYQNPAQVFSPIHRELALEIKTNLELKQDKEIFAFNNAMMELYNVSYRKMAFHSDNALDLKDQSFIAIYSCYNSSKNKRLLRKLVIKDKASDSVCQEILLENNMVVAFSVETNRKYLHKIVVADFHQSAATEKNDTEWLGITFRTSKTFLQKNKINQKDFYLANENELHEFRRLKTLENNSVDFFYPEIHYTISPSDLKQSSPTNSLVANSHLDLNSNV